MKTTKSLQYHSSDIAMLTLALFTLTVNSASAVSQKFTTTGTFTPPAGITSITVECWGGGGAGGGAERLGSANTAGGGGGGGAYAKKVVVPVTPGTPYTVTIPAAASCPSSGFTDGQTFDGSAVTFTGNSGVTVTANGGKGGACSVNSTSIAASGIGGLGAAVSGLYDAEYAGGNGWKNTSGNAGAGGSAASDTKAGVNAASQSTGSNLSTTTGSDADHGGGRGATGKSAEGAGNVLAAPPGGGGGGAKDNTTNTVSYAGSPGGAGQIIISYSGATVTKANNTNNLNLGSSWVGGSAPDPTGTAKWDSTVTSANTTVLGADVAWGFILIADPTDLVTISSGNTLTNNGGIDMSLATNDLTLNCGYALGNSNTFDVGSSRTLRINGIISGASGSTLNKAGSGNLILSGVNTFAGNLVGTGGVMQLGASDVIPDGSGKGNVTLSTGAKLDLNGFSETVNGFTGQIDNTAASTVSSFTVGANDRDGNLNTIRNTGTDSVVNVIKTGTGSVTLSGDNTFTGSLAIQAGAVNLQASSPLDSCAGITMASGTILGMNNNNPVVVSPVAFNGDVKIRCNNNSTTAGPLTLNGVISGTGDLTFDTATNTIAKAAVVLGAANNFTGNVKVTTGGSSISSIALRLAVANALPATTVVTLDGVTNGTSPNTVYTDLDLDGFDLTLAGLQNVSRVNRLQRVYSASTATLTVNNSADYTFGGNLGKTGGDEFGLTKSGKGKFTLSGVNTYTGATIVSGGMLAMGANNIMSSTAVSIGNATLDAATFANTVGTLGVTSTAKINLGTGAALAFADSSGEVWTGGTLDLTGTFVSGASLRFGDGSGTGLTSTQLALITANGFSSFAVDASGFLTATSMGGYSSWKTANSSSQAISLDHDNDGVSNGVEYFLGGSANTTGFTALPGVANTAGTLSVTWTKAASYTGTYGTDFVVETSSTLYGAWTVEALGVNVTFTGDTVKYTFPAGAKNFARLKVTGP